jgi:hypothetical protein
MNDNEISPRTSLASNLRDDVQSQEVRKAYSAPKLTQFGAIASLTKAQTGTSPEGAGSHTAVGT